MGLERLACGYDAATVFLAFGYCLTSRHAAQGGAFRRRARSHLTGAAMRASPRHAAC